MSRLSSWVFLILAALFIGPYLMGDEGVVIMRRMSQRLAVIEALKLSGDIGESNQGYLEARGSLSEKHIGLLREENEDRLKIYYVIALKTNTTKDIVGRHRAAQISMRSIKGIWLQGLDGEWCRKLDCG